MSLLTPHPPVRRSGALWLLVLVVLAGCSEAPDWDPVTVPVVAADLIEQFADGQVTIVRENADQPLAVVPATWEAGAGLAGDANRRVIQAHGESAFELEIGPLAPGAVLRARTLVFTAVRHDPELADPAPVTFRILVDGQERAAVRSDYILDAAPDAHPYDQLMRTLEVPLDDVAGQDVTVTFETTRFGEVPPPDVVLAVPVWWDITIEQPLAVPRQAASTRAPNVLVLCIDTLAARRMSLHGYDRDTTPNLRDFAAGGAMFAEAISPSSWTLPSTASLLTGLPPNAHTVLGDARSYLIEGLLTWPEELHARGIPGAAFVANPLVAEANNFDQGFAHWEHHPNVDAFTLHEHFYDWLDEQPTGARWFAYVHSMEPHAPYAAPAPFGERYIDETSEARAFGDFHPADVEKPDFDPLSEAERQRIKDLYDGEVFAFDVAFAEVLAALEARGMLATTTIILTADHGEELFEHGHIGHGYDVTDVMVHVPLVMGGPRVPAGERRREPVAGASIHNTVLELAGIEPHTDAAPSLFELLEGRVTTPQTVFTMSRTHLFGPRRTLVSARDGEGRKVVCSLPESEVLGTDQLSELIAAAEVRMHDLRRDPSETETVDLAGLRDAERKTFVALRNEALQWFLDTQKLRPSEHQPATPEINQMLRDVGYVDDPEDEDDGK